MKTRSIAKKIIVAVLLGMSIIPAVGTIAADQDNPSISVTADTLNFDGKTYVATATGNVIITRGEATMTGNKAVYNLKSAEADMEGNVSVHQPDLQMTAQKLHSTDKNYVVATGDVAGTYQDKKMSGDKIEYHLDQNYGIITGKGYLEAQGSRMWADLIQGWFKEIRAVGTGNVHIESPADNLVAYGNEAIYTQTPDQHDGVIHLNGNVYANQNGSSLTGEHVVIQLADNSVQTYNGRSTLVIVPGSTPAK
jgi:lipopolysaccharide export system protein LptA